MSNLSIESYFMEEGYYKDIRKGGSRIICVAVFLEVEEGMENVAFKDTAGG
jgi:hypothetical protein